MSAARPQSIASPSCPWANPTANSTRDVRSSPTLQEIQDEELARQMNELELETAARALLTAEEAVGVFDYADYSCEDGVASTTQPVDEEDDDHDEEEDELDDFDAFDEADEVDEQFSSKGNRTRGMGARRRGADPSTQKLQLSGTFDDRAKFVLGKLASRGILSAVDSRVHSSLTSTIHHGKNEVTVTKDGVDEAVLLHYAVKVLKFSSVDHRSQKSSESLQRSGRPMNEEMMWMSIRRQLKLQMDREHSALVRAVACGVRAPAPVCSWEHVLVSAFVGDETKPAPHLRDVALRPGQLAQAYVDLLGAMRAMYQQAKLVHGGLNEFSILYHNDACWITDFSGAIDTVHAEHVDALAQDVESIHSFFMHSGLSNASKHSVGLLHAATMHELITEPAPAKVLGAYPWLKPYLYHKKQ